MCIFCDIANKKIPAFVVYEDEKVMAFLDIKPANVGHTLVIPKKHYNNILDVDEEDLKAMIVVVKKISEAIATILEPDGINVLQNNNPAAGQEIEHIHFHIIPRWENDEVTIKWKHHELNDAEEIAKKLREIVE